MKMKADWKTFYFTLHFNGYGINKQHKKRVKEPACRRIAGTNKPACQIQKGKQRIIKLPAF